MNLSLLASLLLLLWLLMPCLLGPGTALLLGFRTPQHKVHSSQPAAVTLARLYGRTLPPAAAEGTHAQ